MGSTLFIVATPIGNLGDLGQRARQTLAGVDLIAAEDTRHSRRLLDHCGVMTPIVSLHEHNEVARVPQLLARLAKGESIALISDAGTPLVSDPGYRLVRAAGEAGYTVSPIPGPCAAIAALSVAGLATDRFCFEGFLRGRASARRQRLADLASATTTLIFYVTPHRLDEELADMARLLGPARRAVVARELSKLHECVYRGTLDSLAADAATTREMHKGELVVVVEGAVRSVGVDDEPLEKAMSLLLADLSPRSAAAVLAELTGCGRNKAYKLALRLAGEGDSGA